MNNKPLKITVYSQWLNYPPRPAAEWVLQQKARGHPLAVLRGRECEFLPLHIAPGFFATMLFVACCFLRTSGSACCVWLHYLHLPFRRAQKWLPQRPLSFLVDEYVTYVRTRLRVFVVRDNDAVVSAHSHRVVGFLSKFSTSDVSFGVQNWFRDTAIIVLRIYE